MAGIRKQIPVRSPLSARALYRAAGEALNPHSDPRSRLRALLADVYSADAMLYGSGTQALTEAIRRSVADRAGGIVALPAFACYDLASAAVGAGARVMLYDIDPSSLNPDWDSLEHALAAGAATAVIVHLFGFPVHWEKAMNLAESHGAALIEDAAQGIGGTWRGRPLGSLGKTSIISFGRGKGWTGGHGGALLLSGGNTVDVARTRPGLMDDAANLAGTAAQWLLARPSIYGIPAGLPFLGLGDTKYHPPHGPTDISVTGATLALETYPDAQTEIAHRRARGRILHDLLAGSPCLGLIEPLSDAAPGYLRFPVRYRGGPAALAGRRRAGRLGIGGSYPAPLSALPQIQSRLINRSTRFPGAEELAATLITVPLHTAVPLEETAEAAALLRSECT